MLWYLKHPNKDKDKLNVGIAVWPAPSVKCASRAQHFIAIRTAFTSPGLPAATPFVVSLISATWFLWSPSSSAEIRRVRGGVTGGCRGDVMRFCFSRSARMGEAQVLTRKTSFEVLGRILLGCWVFLQTRSVRMYPQASGLYSSGNCQRAVSSDITAAAQIRVFVCSIAECLKGDVVGMFHRSPGDRGSDNQSVTTNKLEPA